MKTKSQNKVLLARLRKEPITTQDARDMGILSLPRRIMDLKEQGHHIHHEWISVQSQWGKTRIVRYHLIKERKKP